ncbi:hypothetical protein QF025_000897 [Paraburkholderia graminis]|uniref:Uncharacterized protein n=1 Tax=Paraburkholderia graminis TaxID=60548 RepID=A0ABD5CE01_9BURK|nr:hypothetical protein [Paraburkholderia graminis]
MLRIYYSRAAVLADAVAFSGRRMKGMILHAVRSWDVSSVSFTC